MTLPDDLTSLREEVKRLRASLETLEGARANDAHRIEELEKMIGESSSTAVPILDQVSWDTIKSKSSDVFDKTRDILFSVGSAAQPMVTAIKDSIVPYLELPSGRRVRKNEKPVVTIAKQRAPSINNENVSGGLNLEPRRKPLFI